MIHTRKVLHIMKKSHLKLALALSAVIALPACETAKPANFVGGQFWQRTSASEALHIRGPKAQQILNRDLRSSLSCLSNSVLQFGTIVTKI